MKSHEQRLNNIIGQLEGIKKMLQKKSDCVLILTQLKAVRSAVGGAMDAIMEEQLETCVKSLKNEDKKLLIKMKEYVKSN